MRKRINVPVPTKPVVAEAAKNLPNGSRTGGRILAEQEIAKKKKK